MEGKKQRAVAACCLLVVVLLSGQQQQVDAFTEKFCRCYRKCYTDCRKYSGPFPCNFECLQDCFFGNPPPSHPASAVGCKYACLIRTCGVVDTTTMAAPGDAEACAADCAKKLGAFAPGAAAKIN